jgi:beta-mannosidase
MSSDAKESPMFETWLLHDFAPGGGERAGAHTTSLETLNAWLPIAVTDDIHRTLVKAGRLEDPFEDRYELKAEWIEGREWWYRTNFTALRIPEPLERLRDLSARPNAKRATMNTPTRMPEST